MKLAEALIERKGLLEQVGTLEQRIFAISTFQEGVAPAEDANKLLDELKGAHAAYGDLIIQINRTNTRAFVTNGGIQTITMTAPAGESVADLIVRRDIAVRHQNSLRRIAQMTRNNLVNARRQQSELRTVTNLDLAVLEHQIAQLGEAARKLDAQIQSANWTIELM